jgi:hypothetical protein
VACAACSWKPQCFKSKSEPAYTAQGASSQPAGGESTGSQGPNLPLAFEQPRRNASAPCSTAGLILGLGRQDVSISGPSFSGPRQRR